jgi:predicted SprT family Zn-dependent metalloprotease
MTDRDLSDLTIEPTKETYDRFQEAYAYFNRGLFGGELPNCLITLQRSKRSYGYFCGGRFGRNDGLVTDEIALNPRYFHVRPVDQVLSTLVHEMQHLRQHHFGKPGRGGYHNREWAQSMKAIGLHPSSTGKEGGQETGDHVTHYIVPGGPFESAANELLMAGFAITWTEKAPETEEAPIEGSVGATEPKSGERSGKRVKYTCPVCRLNAWAKHRIQLVCGKDMTPMEPAPSKE